MYPWDMMLFAEPATGLLALAWSGYFALHSLMASEAVKRSVRSAWPAWFARYRIIYNLLALILLVPLVRWTLSGNDLLVQQGYAIKWAALPLFAAAAYVFYRAVREMDVAEFMGFSPERPNGEGGLLTTGMYAHVRHPLYFATLLLFAGLLIWLPTAEMAVSTVAVVIYLVIGSRLEERKLIARFGEEYLTYRNRVKSLIPYVF